MFLFGSEFELLIFGYYELLFEQNRHLFYSESEIKNEIYISAFLFSSPFIYAVQDHIVSALSRKSLFSWIELFVSGVTFNFSKPLLFFFSDSS